VEVAFPGVVRWGGVSNPDPILCSGDFSRGVGVGVEFWVGVGVGVGVGEGGVARLTHFFRRTTRASRAWATMKVNIVRNGEGH